MQRANILLWNEDDGVAVVVVGVLMMMMMMFMPDTETYYIEDNKLVVKI